MENRNSVATHLLLAVATLALAYFATEVLVPILLAVFAFFLFDPLVTSAGWLRIPRAVAAPALLLVTVLGLYGIGSAVYGGVSGMAHQLPRYSEKIRGIVRTFEAKAQHLQQGTEKLIPQQTPPDDTQKVQVVGSGNDTWTSALLHGVNSVFGLIADFFLIPILTVFFLLEKGYLRKQFERSLGPAYPLSRVCLETANMVRGYFFGNLIVGFVTALGFYGFFTFLGLENRMALALFAGFLNLIPIFGAFIGAILPATQALLQFNGLTEVVTIFVASLFLHFLVNNIVIPKLVGSRINVNASAATVGLVVWGWIWGPLGLLLAIPLMALIRIFLSAHPRTENWANLIAENPEFPSLTLPRFRRPDPQAVKSG